MARDYEAEYQRAFRAERLQALQSLHEIAGHRLPEAGCPSCYYPGPGHDHQPRSGATPIVVTPRVLP